MKNLLQKAEFKINEEMERMGFIDDSDNSARFLDDLALKLATEEILKGDISGDNGIELYYEKEHEIEILAEQLLEKIKKEIMNKYNHFSNPGNGNIYEGCYYETAAGLKTWKEA